jgi:hypothetical protein
MIGLGGGLHGEGSINSGDMVARRNSTICNDGRPRGPRAGRVVH